MRGRVYLQVLVITVLSGCTAFDDAPVTNRNTFVYFYSSDTDYAGSVAELDTDGGFIIAGEIQKNNGERDALIIKTNARGQKVWEKVITNSTINAIKPYNGGYLLAGDTIALRPGSSDLPLSELENTYARIMILNAQGAIVDQHIITSSVKVDADTLTVDCHANAFDITTGGNIVMLGSFRAPGGREAAFITELNPADLSNPRWYQPYPFLDYDIDVANCNAVHATPSGKVVWASSLYNTGVGDITREYVGVSRAPENSTYDAFTPIGDSDTRNHSVADIQKSPVGYCVVGTYAETNGANGNIYFLHLDQSLSVLTENYIDGERLMLNNTILDPANRTTSNSIDEGQAITSTSDGFVIAGTITSTPAVGRGGTDIILIKLDGSGKLIWKKLIGGGGDERVSSIRETPDKGLLICGTNTVNGLSTILLIKTDRNGNLDN